MRPVDQARSYPSRVITWCYAAMKSRTNFWVVVAWIHAVELAGSRRMAWKRRYAAGEGALVWGRTL